MIMLYAGVKMKKDATRYLEIGGIIDTYNLPVQNPDQITSAYIYLSNGGSENDKNIIMTGWEVHPRVFGDGQTYFFTRWADKTRNKGCTNLICPGFVQIDKSFPLGTPVGPASTYNGKQREMSVAISHDPKTKNWWVRLQNKSLGYYPEILFSNLAFANLGGWTGMTSTPPGIPSPPMGSGHFPDKSLLRSCYIRQMYFRDNAFFNRVPEDMDAKPFTDSSCYDVKYNGWDAKVKGYLMLFGGPGGKCGE
ncbi:PREDICTED: uncharacterized protein LOC109341374 [Lupinus angustifolius]|uniref:uncharacterized protein LOC109341374 n=1 Tax=Lupinus angustifolius TaxID=3871 RepID=UPI00092FCEFF|nr:PREDICTED: uncharacterized protein LOC109341374 [Lupinus angustifolius]